MWRKLSATERERITQRNLARLGSRYQENTTPEPRRRLDQAMDVWRARDAYRAQSLLYALAVLLLLLLGAYLGGCQDMGRAAAKLYGYKGDPFPGPCAPESVQTGTCVPMKQGAKP